MTTSIYYDLDEVTLDDVHRARALAPGATEFMARGTVWPPELLDSLPREVPNARDFGFQDQLMNWMDRVWSALGESEIGWNLRGQGGASLLEIARYQFFFEFAPIEQRWRALCAISRRGNVDRVVWVAPAERHRDLVGLVAQAPLRLDLLAGRQSASVARQLWLRAKEIARTVVDGVSDRALRLKRTPAHLPVAENGRVVFVEYFPNSAKVLVPVASLLRERHGIEVLWLAARQQIRELLTKFGIESRLLRELAPVACGTGNHLASEVRRKLPGALAGLPNELYRGTGSSLGRSYLLPAVQRLLSNSLNQAAYWLDAMAEAFERLRPSCVVSTTYTSVVGRAAALAGRACGARSVFVQHGLVPDWTYYARFCNDVLLLWGQSNRRTLVRSGIGPEQIQVVGATIYDDLVRNQPEGSAEHFPRPNQTLRVALMASRTAGTVVSYGAARLILAMVVQGVGQISGAELIVKVHPGDHTGMVERSLRDCPNCTIVQTGRSQDVIRDCDVVIVTSSTTGLEACMADKPLIVLRVPGVPDAVPYESYNAALSLSVDDPDTAEKLTTAIKDLVASPVKRAELAEGRRRLVEDMLNGGAGNAAELVAQAIADLSPATSCAKENMGARE